MEYIEYIGLTIGSFELPTLKEFRVVFVLIIMVAYYHVILRQSRSIQSFEVRCDAKHHWILHFAVATFRMTLLVSTRQKLFREFKTWEEEVILTEL